MPCEQPPRSIHTLADLCQAIEDHRIRATIHSGKYVVRWAELERLTSSVGPVTLPDALASRRPAS